MKSSEVMYVNVQDTVVGLRCSVDWRFCVLQLHLLFNEHEIIILVLGFAV